MEHLGTKLLETERLILRPFVMEDLEAMHRNWETDEEVTRYLMWQPHKTMEESQKVLEEWIAQYSNKNFYQWAIVPKELGEPIGSISVVKQNDQTKMAHIGYCIGKNWWHQGIMSEALQAVMDFLFDEVGVNRVEARHDSRNPHSGAVMRHCGMKYEGTLRQADWNNQGICDACCYALLAEERQAAGRPKKTETVGQIHFEKITEENFREVIRMQRPEKEGFVASNLYSLAQAWLYREAGDVYPFAIYDGQQPVGFMMLDEDLEERCLIIWRILLPPEHQNKGYGTQAIRQIVELARASGKYDFMLIDCVPENKLARHVYEKIGFVPTGRIQNGEIELKLQF